MDIEELYVKIANWCDGTHELTWEGADRIELIQSTSDNILTARLSLSFGALQILGRLCVTLFSGQWTS